MQTRIKIRRGNLDRNPFFITGGQIEQQNATVGTRIKENNPIQPSALTQPTKYSEIGMKININQFKNVSDPFLTNFEEFGKQKVQLKSQSPMQTKNTIGKVGKINSLKRRRNSASSDSSQCSTCSSDTCSCQDDQSEVDEAKSKSRPTNISNRKRLRIRDEIDLALALGISVEELAADRVEQRREEIKTKLMNDSYVVFTLHEEFDIHVRGEHYSLNVQPDPQFYITQGKPILEKIEEEIANAQKTRTGKNGECSTKSCIFQHGSTFTAERKPRRRGGGPVACYVVKPAAGNDCHFEESLVLPQGTCLLRPLNKLVELVAQAINDSPDGLLQVQQVYMSIQNRYPYFKYMDKSSLTSWRSSIRHALYQKWFRKVRFNTELINVRGAYWALNRCNEPREWKLPPNKQDFYFEEGETCEFQPKDLPKLTSYTAFYTNSTRIGSLGLLDAERFTRDDKGVMCYSDFPADQGTSLYVPQNSDPDPMLPQHRSTYSSQELDFTDDSHTTGDESKNSTPCLMPYAAGSADNLQVSTPDDAIDFYPVVSSELSESVGSLEPLLLSPFGLVPSLDQREIEELRNVDYFTGEMISSPM